ncbi:hypothetical protein [Paracoccus jiaweipingae]|uniref:hypothetical protein n=1 Tax=Paracoccus sp. p2-l61 TaxID=3366950 RepID=UPI00379CF204
MTMTDEDFDRQSDEFAITIFGAVEGNGCAASGLLKAAALLIANTAVETSHSTDTPRAAATTLLDELADNVDRLIETNLRNRAHHA